MLTYYAAQLGMALSALDIKNNSNNNRAPVNKGWDILSLNVIYQEEHMYRYITDARKTCFMHLF